MSQEQVFTLEEVARTIRDDRMAAAEKYRLAKAVREPSTSLRILLARTLRSLATLLDRDGSAAAQPERRLVRAY